jgi:hypothetical protein
MISTIHMMIGRLRPNIENSEPKFKYPKSEKKVA